MAILLLVSGTDVVAADVKGARLVGRVTTAQAPPPAIKMVNEGAEKLCQDPE